MKNNDVFLNFKLVVDALINSNCLLQKDEKFFYIEVNNFKYKFNEIFIENNKYYMKIFRELNFIVSEKNRFSKTININGKTKRVICINKNVYKVLDEIFSFNN